MATVPSSCVDAWVRGFAGLVTEHRDELTRLDQAIGDGDHGSNMDRGLIAVVAALDAAPPETPDALLKKVGMTLVSTVGGASGPLFGTLFLRMAPAIGAAADIPEEAVGAALRAGLEGIVARGKAEEGDKTLYDALAPAVDALEQALGSGTPLAGALQTARDAAARGRDATVPMRARKGRASYLGERSEGHQDPGATTMVLLLDAAVAAFV